MKYKVAIGILLIGVIFLVSLLVSKNNQIDYLKTSSSETERLYRYSESENKSLKEMNDTLQRVVYKLNNCLEDQTSLIKKLSNQLKYNSIPFVIRDTIPCEFDVLEPFISPADTTESRGF